MKKILRRGLTLLLALAMVFGLSAPALAADSAAVMTLTKTEGTVGVTSAAGRAMPVRDGLRLYNGSVIETGAASYAWINLDDTKLIKLDANSKVEVRKQGKRLELLLLDGSMYGDVSKKLESDESLHVRSSTAIAGIRGTKVTVKHKKPGKKIKGPKIPPSDHPKVSVSVPDGTVKVQTVPTVPGTIERPDVTIQVKVPVQQVKVPVQFITLPSPPNIKVVSEGESAVANSSDSGISLQGYTIDELPGYVLAELTKDGDAMVPTADGPVLVTRKQAEQRLREDEARAAAASEDDRAAGDKVVSEPVWTGQSQGGSGSTGITGGTGGSSGGSHHASPQYIVTFDSKGGSFVLSQIVREGRLVSRPETPTREGYAFLGWYLRSESGGAARLWDFSRDVVTQSITLLAGWGKLCTITFDTQGGSEIKPITILSGEKLTLPPESPVRPGYVFTGWYRDSACTQSLPDNFNVTADMTLYAGWRVAEKFTVSFDANGGAETYEPQTVDEGAKAAAPGLPTREGYDFDGWFTAADGGEAWDFNADTVSGNMTLYAHWTMKTYTVAFDANGGAQTYEPQTVTHGETAAVPGDPTREGYDFDGWFTAATGGYLWKFDTAVTEDMTLYAQWTANTYTVTFDANGGEGGSTQNVVNGGKATEPADPTRAGYTFDGWFTAATGGDRWDFNTAVTEDTTLYAQWTVNAYTVTFDANGGEGGSTQNVVNGGKATEPADPTRAGYTFDGWFTAATGGTAWDFNTVVTENVTLYAQWTVNTYTVTFDANGGVGDSSQNVTYGETATAPTPAPTKTGFAFTGWYTDSAGQNAYVFSQPVTGPLTLYAGWVEVSNAVAVTFDSQGGSTVASVSGKKGGKIAKPGDPTRIGYVFDGWFREAACTTPWNFDTDTLPTDSNSLTLYAKWTQKSYTVAFSDPDGGNTIASQTVGHGGKPTKPADPTRAGFLFGGWFKEAACTDEWDFTADTVTADVTLHAKWVASYTITFNCLDPDGNDMNPAAETCTTNIEGKLNPDDIPILNDTANAYFLGWYYKDSTIPDGEHYNYIIREDEQFTRDSVLVPIWRPVYTVTFHSNKPDGTDITTVCKTDRNGKAVDFPDFTSETWEGFPFLGWSSETTGTPKPTEWNADHVFTGSIDIYAIWDVKIFTGSSSLFSDLVTNFKTFNNIKLSGSSSYYIGGRGTLSIADGKTLIIDTGANLDIGDSYSGANPVTLSIAPNGKVIINGTITVGSSASIENDGTIENRGTITNDGAYTGDAITNSGTVDGANKDQMLNGNPGGTP